MGRVVIIDNKPVPCPEALRAFIQQCCVVCRALLDRLTTEPERFRGDEHLWRWAILYSVLLDDILGSIAMLAESGAHSRAALILRRSVFEYFVRFRYYSRFRDQARVAMEHATPRLRKFIESIWDDREAKLVEDPTFDLAAHEAEDHKFRDFEAVVRTVFDHRAATRLYGRYYRFPSPLAHGYAEASIDVLHVADNGTNEVHLKSRRPTLDIVMNSGDFAAELLGDIDASLRLGLSTTIDALRSAKAETAKACGIDVVFYRQRQD